MAIRHHKRGVTLIEVLVVVAIISIMTFIVIESYASFIKVRRIRNAAETVQSLMVTARTLAIRNDTWYRLVVQFRDPETGGERYAIWIDEIEPNADDVPNPALLSTPVKAKVTTPQVLPDGIRVQRAAIRNGNVTSAGFAYPADSQVIIRFKHDGTSDYAAIGLIDINDPSTVTESYTTIKLYEATAKPKIFARRAPSL